MARCLHVPLHVFALPNMLCCVLCHVAAMQVMGLLQNKVPGYAPYVYTSHNWHVVLC
jgi:hypothetical protein